MDGVETVDAQIPEYLTFLGKCQKRLGKPNPELAGDYSEV